LTDDEVDAFYAAYGFSLIPGGTPENAEVMYYSGYHAARKKSCACGGGQWTMFERKCGQAERIEHVWNHLNGSIYGTPTRFYKKK